MDFENIGKRMKARREFLGWSLHQAGSRMNASASIVRRWENGEIASLKTTRLQEIADALMTTPAYLLGLEDKLPDNAQITPMSDVTIKQVPILGETLCGIPTHEEEVYDDTVFIPSHFDCDFVVRAKGDSMINARIYDGDLLLVKQQSTVENGSIAAVLINDEVTVKRFYLYPTRIELRPENPTFPVLNYEGEETALIKILGRVVAVMGEVK